MEEQLSIDIERFITGMMTGDEMESFQSQINQNADLAKEVELQKNINAFLQYEPLSENPEETDLIKKIDQIRKSSEGQALKNKIIAVGKQYFEEENTLLKEKKKPNIRMYFVAATVVVIIALSLLLNNNSSLSNHELYSAYYDSSDLPTFVTRGEVKDYKSTVVEQFKEKEYENVIALVKDYRVKENFNHLLFLYSAISYSELGYVDKAIMELNYLEKSNSLDASRAHWYKALIFLKEDMSEKAKNELNTIISDPNNYNFDQAKKLLKKL